MFALGFAVGAIFICYYYLRLAYLGRERLFHRGHCDVVLFAFILAAFLLDPRTLVSEAIVGAGDIRAHIHRISYLFSSLTRGEVPVWCDYWYSGYPFFYTYPPMLYLIGAAVNFFARNTVITYKVLSIFALSLEGLGTYFFARKVLRLSEFVSLISMTVYEASMPIFYTYIPQGAVPCNLAWGFGILFLIYYIRLFETGGTRDLILSTIFLSIVILTHVFPAIMVLAVAMMWHLFSRLTKPNKTIKPEIRGLETVGLSVLITASWWLPFLTHTKYMTPLYEIPPGALLHEAPFLVFAVALFLVILLKWKIIFCNLRSNLKPVWCFSAMLLSIFLGSGIANFLPFGEFLLGWRFLTIFTPFFVVLCFFMVAEKFLAPKKIFAISLIILIAQAQYATIAKVGVPSLQTGYAESAYREIITAIAPLDGKRVMVAYGDRLTESDSLVTFAEQLGIPTVTGAYSQGDPHFFDYTVHAEWGSRMLEYGTSRENLMQESYAGYLLFDPKEGKRYNDTIGLYMLVNNSYGTLFKLKNTPSFVVEVTPILLDVDLVEHYVNFFNVLVPDGYKIVFVTRDAGEKAIASIKYVMVSDEAKAQYWRGKGKSVLQLHEGAEAAGFKASDGVIHLFGPFLKYSNDLFYYAEGDINGYKQFDQRLYNESQRRFAADKWQQLAKISKVLWSYTNITYEPAIASKTNNQITILQPGAGFILVKETWHPSWTANHGSLYKTGQGFILIHINEPYNTISLWYERPKIEPLGMSISIIGLAGLIIVTGWNLVRKRSSNKLR